MGGGGGGGEGGGGGGGGGIWKKKSEEKKSLKLGMYNNNPPKCFDYVQILFRMQRKMIPLDFGGKRPLQTH